MKLLLSIVALALLSTTALANEGALISSSRFSDKFLSLSPYIGIDGQWRKMNFKEEKNIQKNSPQVNVYGALKATDFIAVEVGANFNARGYSSHKNRYKVQGVHLSLVGAHPILGNEYFNALLGLGANASSITVKHLASGTQVRANKVIPRVMGAIQWAFQDDLGLRIGAVWEDTSKLRVNHPQMGEIKPKGSIQYSLGLNYAF